MNKVTFHQLSPKKQFWYASVMIDMVLADGQIHPTEQKFLGVIFELFAGKTELLEQLREHSQKSAPNPIRPVSGLTRKLANMILHDCVSVAIADGEFHSDEKALIWKIGQEMGCSEEEIDQAICWGQHLMGHIFAFAS